MITLAYMYPFMLLRNCIIHAAFSHNYPQQNFRNGLCLNIIPIETYFQEKIEAIQKALAVNTTELSSYIRAKTSATDDRPSAVSIGFVGVALLVTVFGSIILIDSTMLFRDLSLLVRNIRGMFSKDH